MWRRRQPKSTHAAEAARLSPRQAAVLLTLLLGGVALLTGTRLWGWASPELSAVYLALSLALALAGGINAEAAADAFLDGMKAMLLAALLIGLAGAVEVILSGSLALDTVIHHAASAVDGRAPQTVALGLMGTEMVLDVLVPSVSGKAAISIPILAPIGHLSGVAPQMTVLAFLMGGGLMNMVTPTSGMLLAYLSASRVTYGEWIRFIAPLFLGLTAVCGLALVLLV